MFLGIDLGTGSVKVIVLDRSGNEFSASRAYRVSAPEDGYAETDTSEWVSAIRSAIQELGHTVELRRIESIGLSGQMHGVVPVKGPIGYSPEAIYPAILWADRRGVAALPMYRSLDAEVRNSIGNTPASGMAGPTIWWLKNYRSEVYSDTDHFLLPKDFIRATLTGDRLTDHSDAGGTLLYDFERTTWHRSILDTLGIDETKLPEIKWGTVCAGVVTPDAAECYGIPQGIPVAVGGGDTPVAMYGTKLNDPGIAQISVGTAAQVARVVDPEHPLPPLSSLNLFDGVDPGRRFHVAAMLNGGLALEWVRDRFQFEWNDLYTRLSPRVSDDPMGLHFIPYLSGERTPYMNPNARGAWVGLSLHHDTDDLIRSALFGVACTVRLGIETLEKESGSFDSIRLIGGSARHEGWRKILAMIIGRPLLFTSQTDASARGAAAMAAKIVGESLPDNAEYLHQGFEETEWVDDYFLEFREVYHRLHSIA